jgi:hypothetical protein
MFVGSPKNNEKNGYDLNLEGSRTNCVYCILGEVG